MSTSKKKLKIAFIHPDLGIGGAERLVLDVAGALSQQGHEVLFITNHFDPSHAFEELKTGAYPVKVFGDWIPRSILGRFQALCAYIRMIYLIIYYVLFEKKIDKPDLYFVDLIPIAIPILKRSGEKVIYYCHHPDLLASAPGGALKKLYRKPIDWLELKSTAQADVLLVNSNYTASIFRETFPEINKTIQILYPSIAYSYLEHVKDLQPKPIVDLLPEIETEDNTIFLSVNRFHPAKKLHLAILAMDKLREMVTEEQWSRIYLIMAGGFDPQSTINSHYYSQLSTLISERCLQEKVIFLKSPPDDFKADLLCSCDCLIYTPINEHFGIVPLEAMAVAKPVIACNSGGPCETISNNENGYLCEPNPESMAQCMKKIVLNENVKEMGAKGKKRLEDKFSYQSFSNSLKNILNDFQNKFL